MPDLSDSPFNNFSSSLGLEPVGNPTSQTTDTIESLGDKPYATEKVPWNAEKTLEVWRRIEGGRAYQDKRFKQQYMDALRLWNGEHWPENKAKDPYEGYLITNLIPNFVKSKVEAVAFNEPEFIVSPWNSLGERNQMIARSVLRYWWRESHCQRELKRATYDKELFGVGIVQIGWLFQTEDIKLDEGRLAVQPDPGDPLYTDPQQQSDTIPTAEVAAPQPVPQDEVLEDRFLVRRLNPMDFLVPPEASSVVDDWPWCVRIERRPLAAVKRDPLLKNKANLRGTTHLSQPYLNEAVTEQIDERHAPDTRYIELLHYYERDRRLHIILCAENPTKPLLVEKWTWQTRRYPFRTVHNSITPDEFYGKSTPVELWSNQVDINECATQIMEHRRQFNRQYQVPKDVLDEAAIYALEEGSPGAVIQYDSGVAGPNPVQPIPHAQLQPEVYQSMQTSLSNMERLSGLSQYQMHNPPTKRLSATESQAIQGAGGILFVADSQQFTNLCCEVAEDLLDYCQQYAAVTRELPIYDAGTSSQAWIDFTGDEIRGDYLVEVVVGSTQPPDTGSELQKNQVALQTVIQAMQLAAQMGGALPRPLAIVMRESLRIIGTRNIDDLIPLPPLPPPTLPPGQMQGPGQMPMLPPGQPQPPGVPPLPESGGLNPQQIALLQNLIG